MLPSRSLPLGSNAAAQPSTPGSRIGANWLQRLWVPVSLLVAWELAVAMSLLDPLFFPPPSKLLATGLDMMRNGDLGERVGDTIARAGIGFLAGALTGILCGAATGSMQIARRALAPLIAVLYNVPKLVLLPMLMLLAGTGETPRLILIAAAAFLQVVMHTQDGVQRVSPHYIEMATHHGATRWLLFRRIYLPASLPQIFTGLRLGIGRALVVTISAELLTGAEGLGGLVARAWQTFAIEQLYVAVTISGVLGACLHSGLKLVETRILPWRSS